jgi:diacylglycerol kinase family enzyme
MSALVLINAEAGRVLDEGADRIQEEIGEALARSGAAVRMEVAPVPDLLRLLREAREDTVVTVGGDGTVGAVAGALAAMEAPPRFVPLPFGTANLFTRDLGLPLDPMEALEAAIGAKTRRIDYARANEHPLLHSAVFGTFAEVAEAREHLRKARTPGEFFDALAEAAGDLLRADPLDYHLVIDGEALDATTNAVFVTNNAITGGERGVPVRERLDAGELVVYLSDSVGPLGFIKRVIEAVTGGFDDSDGIIRHVCRTATVTSGGGPLVYSADGEVIDDEREVRFVIEPGALGVPDLRR